MADNVQTTTTFASDTPTEWFKAEVLERSERYQVFPRYGMSVKLPGGQGDTVQFVRYNRPGAPSTTLEEGVTPDGQEVTISEVTCQVDQWGGYFTLSDKAILQTYHGPFEQVAELAAEQWGIVRDRECQRVLRRGTNDFYANNRANRAALTATDYMTTTDAIRIVESLRAKGAPTYEGGDYVAIMPTAVEADMMTDATWVQTKTQQDQGPLERGEFLRWMGCKFVRSNQIPSMVLNTSCNPTSITTPAASGSETEAIGASGDLYINLVAVDKYGQEFAMGASQQTASGADGDIVAFTVPALITGAEGYNCYASALGGTVGTETLQARNLQPGVHHLTGNGVAASGTGVAYTSTGQLIEPVPAASVTVHPVFFVGKNYFACTENGAMTTTMTQPTTSGRTTDSDPLGQRRKVGWKGYFKDCILNEDFGAILWCASRFSGYQTV